MAEEFNVKIGADTGSLEKGTELASASIESLVKEVQSLHKSVVEGSQAIQDILIGALEGAAEAAEEFGEKAEEAGEKTKKTNQEAGLLDGTLKKLAATIIAAFSIRAAVGFAQDVAEVSVQLTNLRQQLGMAESDIAAWEAVVRRSGGSLENFQKETIKLIRAQEEARDGNNQYREAFRELGIDIEKARTNQELLFEAADAFKDLPEGPRKTALAVQLLGASGGALLPVFNRGSAAIRDGMASAQESGEAASASFIENGLRIDESLSNMSSSVTALSHNLAEGLGPSIIAIADYLTRLVQALNNSGTSAGGNQEKFKALGDVIKVVITLVGAFIVALQQAWAIMQAIAQAVVSVALGIFEFGKRLASGDLTGAVEVFKARMSQAIELIKEDIDSMSEAQRNYNELYADLWRQADSHSGDSLFSPGGTGERLESPGTGGQRLTEADVKQQLEALRTKQEAVKDDFDQWVRLQDERIRLAAEYYGKDSDEYQRYLTEKVQRTYQNEQELTQVARSAAQARSSILISQAQADSSIAQVRLDSEISAIDRAEARGQISAQRAVALKQQVLQRQQQLELESANRIYQIQLDTLNKQLELENLKPREREKILQQIEVLEAQHAARMSEMQANHSAQIVETQRDAADAVYEKWESVLDPIGQSFNSMFQQLYYGQETWKGAFLKVLDQILFSFVQMGINMVVRWAANQLAMTAATTTGAATRTAVETGAAATSAAASSGFALIDIANAAVRAAANAYAAIAGIPFVGPFLAPAIAAGAIAAVIGFSTGIISARGGLDRVDKDGQLAELHKDEMVLPAGIATPLRDAIAGWTIAQSSRETVNSASDAGQVLRTDNSRSQEINLNYGPTVNSEANGLDSLLRRDAQTMRKWLRNEARNGRLTL